MTSRGERGRSPAMRTGLWAVRVAALPFLLLGMIVWGVVVGSWSLARALGLRRGGQGRRGEPGVGIKANIVLIARISGGDS